MYTEVMAVSVHKTDSDRHSQGHQDQYDSQKRKRSVIAISSSESDEDPTPNHIPEHIKVRTVRVPYLVTLFFHTLLGWKGESAPLSQRTKLTKKEATRVCIEL